MKTAKKPVIKLNMWQDSFYLRTFELAKQGHSDSDIRRALGVGPETWKKWLKLKPALAESLTKGRLDRSGKSEAGDFKDYIYHRLPARLKPVWDKIVDWDATGDEVRIEALLAEQGRLAKQHLWCYAYCHTLFSVTDACKMVGVKPSELAAWKERDPDFAEIVDNVFFQAKKDFCESALMRGVASGDPTLVKFANETLNADRGYNKKSNLHITGEMTHKLEERVTVERLLDKLPLEDQLKLLAAFENKGEVVDALPLPAHLEEDEDV